MRMRMGAFGVLAMALSTGVWGQGSLPGAGTPANFNVAAKTRVPGEVLKPGPYTIHVVDRLEDRIVVEVDGAKGKDHELFLAVPAQNAAGSPGPIAWDKGVDGAGALRGFRFADGALEFVYPKETAVALAKANGAPVVAVDPDSEGKPKVDKMSADERRIVSLWLLSITQTGPSDATPAVLAKHYQPTDAQQGVEARSTPPRATTPPSNETASVSAPTPPPIRAAYRAPRQKPVVSELPHTASGLPLIGLAGLVSFFTGCCLMMRRRLSL